MPSQIDPQPAAKTDFIKPHGCCKRKSWAGGSTGRHYAGDSYLNSRADKASRDEFRHAATPENQGGNCSRFHAQPDSSTRQQDRPAAQ